MIQGEINFTMNGKKCKIWFNNHAFPRCLTVWGAYDSGKRDWDGSIIMSMCCQMPASYSENQEDPIGEAFDRIHANLESNTSYVRQPATNT